MLKSSEYAINDIILSTNHSVIHFIKILRKPKLIQNGNNFREVLILKFSFVCVCALAPKTKYHKRLEF